jgi:transcription elongation GreA/GreB family factor
VKHDAAFKVRVLAALRAQLAADLEALKRSQEDSHAGATHAESRPEHAKDTRSVEASYLARGLAERVVTLQNASSRLEGFELRTFAPDDVAALSALVELEVEGAPEPALYFLAPAGGGVALALAGETVHVVTPTSPIGSALMGCEVGDEVAFRTPKGSREVLIAGLT